MAFRRVIQIFTPTKKQVRETPYEPIPESDDRRLHYGICPRCKSFLRKKGKNAFCKKCGYTKSRAVILQQIQRGS